MGHTENAPRRRRLCRARRGTASSSKEGGVPLRPQRENFSGYHRFDAVLSGFSGRVVCSSSAYDQIF